MRFSEHKPNDSTINAINKILSINSYERDLRTELLEAAKQTAEVFRAADSYERSLVIKEAFAKVATKEELMSNETRNMFEEAVRNS